MTFTFTCTCTTLLLAGLISLASADPLTRSSGLISHYGQQQQQSPEDLPPEQQQRGYAYNQPNRTYGSAAYPMQQQQQQQQVYDKPIRITLTRNTSLVQADGRPRAPEVSYYGVVGVGSPPQLFNVMFDTATSEIWLPKYNWLELFANNLHYGQGFRCSDSSTCRETSMKFDLNYWATSLTGVVHEDVMSVYEDLIREDVGVLPETNRFEFGQDFLAIHWAEDEQFRWKPYDGAIGLAPVSRSKVGTQQLLVSFEQAHQQRMASMGYDQQQQQQSWPRNPYGQVSNNMAVFGLWLNPNLSSRHGGELTLGGVDVKRFFGDIQHHRLVGSLDWRLPLDRVQLGGEIFSRPTTCLLDTARHNLAGPRPEVESIYQLIGAQFDADANLWRIECQRIEDLPPLSFSIDHHRYPIYGQHYVRKFSYQGANYCYVNIVAWDKPDWALGTSFLGAFYTVFDMGNRLVGFAQPN